MDGAILPALEGRLSADSTRVEDDGLEGGGRRVVPTWILATHQFRFRIEGVGQPLRSWHILASTYDTRLKPSRVGDLQGLNLN